ncbi:MAG: GxxExxY protein [Bacteroidota bacterium]
MMDKVVYKDESFSIMGRCMEIHNNLGPGFLEVVYKDALEYEFKKNGIPFQREKEFEVAYKDAILPHKFYADFVVFDKIILEVKAVDRIHKAFIAQAFNYLAVSGLKLAIIVNFGEQRLSSKRILK